jgi:serine/threonine protein kinase
VAVSEPGFSISHYRLEAQLGKGGMGLVYRAHDERLDRKVAIKLLPEQVAGDAEHRARLMAEARAASALNHPGIVTIHEVGEDSEKLFIESAEFSCNGGTVQQRLSGRFLSVIKKDRICMTRALQAAGRG